MFDLSRITDLVADFIGEAGANGGVQQILQNLGEHGIDLSQLEGLDTAEVLSLLAENGIEVSQLDAGQLSQLADQLGIELPLGDILEPFSGQPPTQ